MNRRDFMMAGAGLAALMVTPSLLPAGELWTKGAVNAEKLGWRVGCQLYSFHTKTFEEAVQMTARLGLKVAEGYPGHRMAATGKPISDRSAESKKLVKKILAENGVKLAGYGVNGCDRATFEFAKEMGFEYLTFEPAPNSKAYDALDKLVEEFDIKISVHNHPKPSPYWNYETEVKLFADHDPRIGACVDSNHFIRSGLDPIKAIQALKGRIMSFHFGDIKRTASGLVEVPLGTGDGKVAEQLAELQRQGFKGCFAFENERNPGENLADIAASVKFFDETAKSLLG